MENQSLADLRSQEVSGLFKNYMRLSFIHFKIIIIIIGSKITKMSTKFCDAHLFTNDWL